MSPLTQRRSRPSVTRSPPHRNSNDAAALAATYADDAIMMDPNQAAIEGKQAIQAAYEAMV